MKLKLLYFILLTTIVSIAKCEEVFYLPSRTTTEMRPLSSFDEVDVKVTNYVNFQYQVQGDNQQFLGKIWTSTPLYGRKGKVIRQIRSGFNVQFLNMRWLIAFMKNQGFTLVWQQRNIYKFKYDMQNEIALK